MYAKENNERKKRSEELRRRKELRGEKGDKLDSEAEERYVSYVFLNHS